MNKPETGIIRKEIIRYHTGTGCREIRDEIIAETPLEIIIGHGRTGARVHSALASTMRTPGDDFNLVAGWLFAEGIISGLKDLSGIRYGDHTDMVVAELSPGVIYDELSHIRRFPISSACGWCGRFKDRGEAPNIIPKNMRVQASVICHLPETLRSGQGLFDSTGGAHAVALTDTSGQCILRCEDVGRHNAMDKLTGSLLRAGKLPLSGHIVVFSGRLGYELVQKSLAAGVQIVCSIGAPSSAALELAEAYGITVCGFVKETGFNLYSGNDRIQW
ncbi:MAG: formate dehydrogenase accessory sulfurtransferase FdhD [Bacteroidota bacterium]